MSSLKMQVKIYKFRSDNVILLGSSRRDRQEVFTLTCTARQTSRARMFPLLDKSIHHIGDMYYVKIFAPHRRRSLPRSRGKCMCPPVGPRQ